MFLSCEQMKAVEAAAFARGISSEQLMAEAGRGIAEAIRQFCPRPGTAVLFAGKGHNGDDARIAARHLATWDWQILEPSQLPLSRPRGPLIAIDGLLGVGSTGAPRGLVAPAIHQLNALRQLQSARVFAVDLPSGLDPLTGEPHDPCVRADVTITLGQPKSCLVADSAADWVGRLVWVPLRGLETDPADLPQLSCPETLAEHLPLRNFDSHKGSYGRVGIIAGSEGFLGAARLCAAAAVHAGAGLVTLFVRRDIYPALAGTVIPEVMVQAVDHYAQALEFRLDALAVGPGLGRRFDGEVLGLIQNAPLPLIVDADALNALASDRSCLKRSAGPRLLTPHLGEMARLWPEGGATRREIAEAFTARYPATLLMKSARSLIAQQGKVHFFNSTGNPGMGSGGMGDVLTGVCAAQIAGGRALIPSAALGAWLCGRAAELACLNMDSEESLSATRVIRHLGQAFPSLQNRDF